MALLKSLLITAIIFIVLDMLWLGIVAKKIYIHYLGGALRLNNTNIDVNWGAAFLVYIALIAGILLFVIPKAAGSPILALLYGAIFGFVTYVTYDCTNLAVLRNWSIIITVIDVLWGMIICSVTSAISVWICSL